MNKFLLLFSVFITLKTNAQVPAQWDTAKVQINNQLQQINTAIQSSWNNDPYCSSFAGNLQLANSNRGYALFTHDPENYPYPIPAYQNPLYAKIDTLLMAFDSLGYTSVDLTVQYPMLVNSFKNSQYYLDFFKTVSQKIKAKGFRLIIGCQAAFVDSTFGEKHMVDDILAHYFNPDGNLQTDDSLEINRYRSEKLQMMQTILDELQPDYLTLEMEPQTQEVNLFKLINYSVDSAVALVNYFTANLNKGAALLGAGAGTWDHFDFFVEVAQTNIDYLDYHIYPPHFSYIDNMAFRIDSLADATNKKLVIGESWCYKATNFEMADITDPVATSALVYSRDVFNFWQETDTLFIKAMYLLSQQSKVELVQFHWPMLMFGQITHNPSEHDSKSSSELLNLGQQYGYQQMWQMKLSPVGEYTQNLLKKLCDEPVSTDNISKNKTILVFPNPANNEVEIIWNSKENLGISTISITNLMGQLVYSKLISNNQESEITVNTSNLTNGIYIVEMRGSIGKSVKKIVVQH